MRLPSNCSNKNPGERGTEWMCLWTTKQLPLQHPRQILAPRTARIIHFACNLLRAFGGQFIEPIDDLAIAATLIE